VGKIAKKQSEGVRFCFFLKVEIHKKADHFCLGLISLFFVLRLCIILKINKPEIR